ncbi:MAG: Rnl2 family RNA ligase [Crocinitomix sp.]|jgi:Rnl2 family RNA ligase
MFKKYNSIENTYREEVLNQIKLHEFADHTYAVQEKAHGANTCFWTINGDSISTAKRSGLLEEGEKFYNHDSILVDLAPKIKAIWKELKNADNNLNQITIFGEIIGGAYPHKDVERNKNATKVQKGIYYSPDNCFYAFDILLNVEEYLSVDECVRLFEEYDIFHAKTLFKGSLTDCLDYPNDFESKIPSEFNLPEILPNVCEGVVIKPLSPLFFRNDSRVILKNKNERWAENTRFNKVIKQQDLPSEKVIKLQEAIATYATENRLNNVLSKIGEVSVQDFGKVVGLFNKDILEDFTKDYHEHLSELEKKEVKVVTKSFSKKAATLVKIALQK